MVARERMTRRSPSPALGAVSLTLVALLGAACAGSARSEPQDPAVAERVAALRAAGVQAHLVLYPVRLLERPDQRVADALGLVLEKQGMPDLAVADAAFVRPRDVPWSDVPARFAAHVQAAPVSAASYHLYAEVLGTPRTGPEQVRFVVIDAQGRLVLRDEQQPGDRDFDRTAARDPDPLGCMALVAERLFTRADWRKAAPIVDGPFERKWRELSGAPSASEQSAMRQRQVALKQAFAGARIAVLPTVTANGRDAASAQRLAALLHERFAGDCTPANGDAIDVRPDSNEQRMLWDLARGLRAVAPRHAQDADYVLVADVGGDGAKVRYVHMAICTTNGDYVVVDHENDQSPLLVEMAPKTLADAERFVVARLAKILP